MTTEREWTEDGRVFAAAEFGDEGPLAREFVALAAALAGAGSVAQVLERVVGAVRMVVSGADLASVTMRAPDGSGFHTPTETDPLATRLDELQYSLGEGPCVAATCTGALGVVHDPDLASGEQFPAYGPAAAELGVGAVLAVGLFPQGEAPRMGALNLYSHEPRAFSAADRDAALVLAALVATALAATRAYAAADLERVQLREALRSRDVIGQAKGILMERQGISADEAFDVLRRSSQSLNVKLAEVAETLASRRAEL